MQKRFPAPGAKIAFLPLICVALSGCFDENHYIHRDFISGVAGDAIAVNAATQTDNPWPKEAQNANITVSAKRLDLAVRCYQENKSFDPQGLSTSDVTQQAQTQGQQSTAQTDPKHDCLPRRTSAPSAPSAPAPITGQQ